MSEIEKLKSVHETLEKEKAGQKMLEIKIQNNEIERESRLTEITKRISMEEKNLMSKN